MARRILMCLATLFGTLLVLEIVLQSLAFAVWLSHRDAGDDAEAFNRDDPAVLCLGDSYTYGMGASQPDNAYPSQLQTLLAERSGQSWKVANESWPSRNSRELLELLDSALARHKPSFVCIVIGINDGWSHPEQLVLDQIPTDHPQPSNGFRWRVRTLRMLRLLVGGATAEATENPDEKLNELRDCLRRGKTIEAADLLAWLRSQFDEHPCRWHAETLVDGLEASGREEEAFDLARATVEHYPDSSRLWLMLAKQSARVGDLDAARQSIDRSIECATQSGPGRAFLWRTRAAIFRDTDPEVTAKSLVHAWMDDHDPVQTRQWFQVHHHVLNPELISTSCSDLGLAPQEQEIVDALFAEAGLDTDDSKAASIFASHLRQIIQRSRNAGAKPILGSYPFDGAFGSEIVRSISRETSTPWVDIRARFHAATEETPSLDLFVHDGHCNDAGYRLMAEAFADVIVTLMTADKAPPANS